MASLKVQVLRLYPKESSPAAGEQSSLCEGALPGMTSTSHVFSLQVKRRFLILPPEPKNQAGFCLLPTAS